MMRAGQGMTDQHRVVAGIVQLAIGFIDQFMTAQHCATGEGKRLVKMCDLGCHQTHTAIREVHCHESEPEHEARR